MVTLCGVSLGCGTVLLVIQWKHDYFPKTDLVHTRAVLYLSNYIINMWYYDCHLPAKRFPSLTVDFACSPYACTGFLGELRFSPKSQTHAAVWLLNCLYRCKHECIWPSVSELILVSLSTDVMTQLAWLKERKPSAVLSPASLKKKINQFNNVISRMHY